MPHVCSANAMACENQKHPKYQTDYCHYQKERKKEEIEKADGLQKIKEIQRYLEVLQGCIVSKLAWLGREAI